MVKSRPRDLIAGAISKARLFKSLSLTKKEEALIYLRLIRAALSDSIKLFLHAYVHQGYRCH